MKKALCLLLLTAGVLRAQEPEVRRAEPVQPAMTGEVRRAEPVNPATAPNAVDAAAGLEEVRAAPAGTLLDPTSQILSQANGFYARKMYDLAAEKYREFLQSGRPGPDRRGQSGNPGIFHDLVANVFQIAPAREFHSAARQLAVDSVDRTNGQRDQQPGPQGPRGKAPGRIKAKQKGEPGNHVGRDRRGPEQADRGVFQHRMD